MGRETRRARGEQNTSTGYLRQYKQSKSDPEYPADLPPPGQAAVYDVAGWLCDGVVETHKRVRKFT